MKFISENGELSIEMDETEYFAYIMRQKEKELEEKRAEKKKKYERIVSLINEYEEEFGIKILFRPRLDPGEYLARLF